MKSLSSSPGTKGALGFSANKTAAAVRHDLSIASAGHAPDTPVAATAAAAVLNSGADADL